MGTDSILLSIIIPAYNVKDYIQECIDSIILPKNISNDTQDELDKRIEIIIVDDGSTDGTAELCDRNAEVDSRIRVIHQQNSGVAAARNTGIKNAAGDWILFVDSDDWIYLEVIRELLQKSDIEKYDMLGFSIEMERPNGSLKISSNTGKWFDYDITNNRTIFQTLCLQNQMYWPDVEKDSYKYPIMTFCYNKIFKKSMLIDNCIYMKKDIAMHEDRIFNYECVNKLKTLLFYDKVAYHYRYRPSSAVHSDGVKMIDQMRDTIYCFRNIIGDENKSVLDGPFAYACAQILWTLVDRLGNSSPSINELSSRARYLKDFMKDQFIKATFKTIKIGKVHSIKHRIVCYFLKHEMTFPPIFLCYCYHRLLG